VIKIIEMIELFFINTLARSYRQRVVYALVTTEKLLLIDHFIQRYSKSYRALVCY
jgi:hypothetical protein